MIAPRPRPLFHAGAPIVSDKARDILALAGVSPDDLVRRHETRQQNILNMLPRLQGARATCYPVTIDIWVTTENNVTTVVAVKPAPSANGDVVGH